MPAGSPENMDDITVRLTVLVDGTATPDSLGITSVQVVHEVNRISFCEIVLTGDIDIAGAALPDSDGDIFVPGKTVKVTAGYGDAGETSIFEGVIVKHGISIDTATSYSLRLLCKHKAVRLTFNRREAEFKDKTDSDVISAIFSTYGISCTVDSTSAQQENFLQWQATDWDIVLSRAEFNGFVILLDGDSVKIGKPTLSASPVLRVALGDSITEFSAELDAERQPSSIEASAWDSKTGALVKATATEPTLNTQGNLAVSDLPTKLTQDKLGLHAALLPEAELKTWADGQLLRMRLAALKGRVTFIGSSLVKTGGLITLEGVGQKFNGDAYVSTVTHIIEEGMWRTSVGFGLDDRPVSESPDFSYVPATGQLPSVQGLQVGTVKQLASDPQSAYRLLVELASVASEPAGVWARVSNFYATSSAGLGFLPEVGDEVIVGFLDGDPRFPVVLGSLYSGKNVPPNPANDEKNYIKSLTTKSGMKLSFDDENKVVVVQTPGANSITISDKDKSIEIKDQNSNVVKLSSDGISLSSPKDIVLDAKGGLKLTAATGIKLSASGGDVEAEGLNVKNTAQVGFTAKGNATAELSASGQTTVKGGIVMIN